MIVAPNVFVASCGIARRPDKEMTNHLCGGALALLLEWLEIRSATCTIRGYPHLFVLDADGKLLHSQNTADLEEGRGYNEGVVLAFLAKWAPKR